MIYVKGAHLTGAQYILEGIIVNHACQLKTRGLEKVNDFHKVSTLSVRTQTLNLWPWIEGQRFLKNSVHLYLQQWQIMTWEMVWYLGNMQKSLRASYYKQGEEPN